MRHFSVLDKNGDCVFELMEGVIKTADIQGGVVGQVDVGSLCTISGQAAVDPVDGVRVKVLPWEQSRYDHSAVGEGGGGFLYHSFE